jgi:Beta-propeller repeat
VNPLFALLLAGAVHGLFTRLNPNALPQPSARHEKGTVCGAGSPSPGRAVREAWVARYGGTIAKGIVVDGSGNVYVTGTSGDDYATIKYSPVGQELWLPATMGER